LIPLARKPGAGYQSAVLGMLKERLKTAVAKSGRSARDVSMKATGKPGIVRDIIRGRSTNPRSDTLQAIATELGLDVNYFTGGSSGVHSQGDGDKSDAQVVSARVVHVVQAGPFVPIDMAFADEDDPKTVPTVPDPDFPRLRLIAFLVKGDSINKICPDGGYAIAVDFAETGLAPKPGMWVVAERIRGDLVERTIKVIRSSGNGKLELHPHSTNPVHKPIRFPSAEKHEEVRIHALVRHFETPTLRF
jgi:hypothetical protein